MKALDEFYFNLQEPNKSCLLALQKIILSQDADITAEWKYKLPFFCYKGKMFCYLWIQKKTNQPYIGIVEGKYFEEPEFIQENRSRMKIILFDSNEDLPIQKTANIIQKAIDLYKTGIVKI
jgi:Domain of unknown function (DU1801)